MIQHSDILFISVLIALSALMWFARAFTLVVLQFVPVAIAVVGTLGTVFLLYVGQSMHWQTPDSPGLLLIFFALFISIVIATIGWIAFSWQRRRGNFKNLQPRMDQPYKVAIAIVIMWGVLGPAYHFYRNHQSSHDANVVAFGFAAQSRYLFSLDRNGHLKKWDLARRSQIAEWQLKPGTSSKMVAREDATSVFVLSNGQLTEYRLLNRLATPIERGAYLDVADLGGGDVAILTASELTIFRPESDQPRFQFPLGNGKNVNAKTITALTTGSLIVLFSDQSRRILEFRDGDLHPQAPPNWLDQKSLKLQMASPSPMLVTVWADMLVQSTDLTLQGFQSPERSLIPLFHGGGRAFDALLASRTAGGPLAIGVGPEIYVKYEKRYDTKDEVWLNGNIRLPAFLTNLFPE